MPEEEEEERELPSVPRRKEVELGRGIVLLPPERLEAERKEKEMVAPPKPRPPEAVRPAPAQNIIAVLAIFIAVVAAILASFSIYNVYKMKTELRAIAADLREFQDSNIVIETKLVNVTHAVEASLPIKEIIAPFSIPILPQELSGNGSIRILMPGTHIPVTIPWEGNVTVSGSVRLDTSQLAEDRRMALSYELPGEGQLTITIKGRDLWTTPLENVTERIEAMSQFS